MRIEIITAAATRAERRPPVGGWTSYCQLATSLPTEKVIKEEEDRTEHDRGH